MAADGATRTERVWVAIAALLCVAGMVAAAFGANAVARTAADRSHRQLESDGREIAARFELALQHETDLVATAKAYVIRNPGVRTTEFVGWANDEQALARYPELVGLGLIRLVPRSELASFGEFVAQDSFNVVPPGGFEPDPPGDRAIYCFVAAGAATRTVVIANNYDFCADRGRGILHARDSGRGSYEPVEVPGTTLLGFEEPVYAGDGIPTDVAARRERLVGWIGMVVEPSLLLRSAAPHSTVRMHYEESTSNVTFTRGRVPAKGESVRVAVGDRWTIEAFGPVIGSSILDDRDALLLLLGGSVVSFLVGALIVVLATGRSRARRLVRDRTNELRHLAMHDPLTGLANRALLRDRCEVLIERSRQTESTIAALYVDIDHFKHVNDTFGHDAGDRVLVELAERLARAVRGADTIARLGGDEFVILLDADAVDSAPMTIAERLRAEVGRPCEPPGSVGSIVVTASVGVATGPAQSPSELLRRADAALYDAKAHGRDRVVMFRSSTDAAPTNVCIR
jgi:diguanylate cyclase (GGDEF)-like protein